MMKHLLTLSLLLLTSWVLPAQNPCVALVGGDASGFNYPQSVLVVDVELQKECVVAGPYARYALKFLGLRAPFSDKTTYSVVGAQPALGTLQQWQAEPIEEPVVELATYARSQREFSALAADRYDMIQPAPEEAAQQAATRLFQLRRARLDLITAEAGEHVFGQGLQAALDELAAQEQALLELFLGKRWVERTTHRLEVNLDPEKRQYILSRFSPSDGLLDASDLSGEILLLEIHPGKPYAVEEASEKSKSTLRCRVAAPALCVVKLSGEELGSRELPLFEFGKTIRVEQ